MESTQVSVHWWIIKGVNIYKMEYYSAMGKKKILAICDNMDES